MARAGWCGSCEAYVWLSATGGCVHGHELSEISREYEAEWEGSDPIDEAIRTVEDAAERVGTAAKEAWDETTPRVKKAWDDAQPAMRRAGETAGRAVEELGTSIKTFTTSVARKDVPTDGPPPPADDTDSPA